MDDIANIINCKNMYFLGIYTAKIMLFYFFLMFAFGGFVWSIYIYFQASGSTTRRRKRQRAFIWMIFFGVALILMGLLAIIRQTDRGQRWLDQFLS
jgi:hypothetical protein